MSRSEPDLERIAGDVVELARAAGASDAEASIADGTELSVTVRMGEVQTLKQSGSRAAGVRLLFGRRAGSSYTSDLSPEGLRTMVRQAADIARISAEDPLAGLPDAAELGSLTGDLALYCEDVAGFPADTAIDYARRAERAALDVDERISNSEGGLCGATTSRTAFANSRGFVGSYRTSSCSVTAIPVAASEGRMERDYWYSVARSVAGLEPPEEVGRRAGERVLRRLNPRKVETCRAPVVFEARMARTLVGHLFDAVSGDAVYRRASFLAGKLRETVAAPCLSVIDDATLPGLFGTSPFDDEGVPSRRTPVIERGVLASYLLNSYTARKLGLKTTGNASRGVTGNAQVGHGNLFVENGAASLEELFAAAGTGLYVTELLGMGVNTVTGDYSRGASGLWIEKGELAFAVSEVTIAGNLKEMLMGVMAVGNDLEFRGSVASPSLLVREMTISGR